MSSEFGASDINGLPFAKGGADLPAPEIPASQVYKPNVTVKPAQNARTDKFPGTGLRGRK